MIYIDILIRNSAVGGVNMLVGGYMITLMRGFEKLTFSSMNEVYSFIGENNLMVEFTDKHNGIILGTWSF